VNTEQIGQNVERLAETSVAQSTLLVSDLPSINAAAQSQAARYLREYNEMVSNGSLPAVHISETVSANRGDLNISAHYNQQGHIDRIVEHDSGGHERTYSLDDQGKVIASSDLKISRATGDKFDPEISAQPDQTK
jgi:hypothetical protein